MKTLLTFAISQYKSKIYYIAYDKNSFLLSEFDLFLRRIN